MFLEPEVTIFGQLGRAATVHPCPHWQVTLLAARQIEGSRVLPLMDNRIKDLEQKGPPTAALLPVSVFTRQGSSSFSLNICLGWKSALWLAAKVLERERERERVHLLQVILFERRSERVLPWLPACLHLHIWTIPPSAGEDGGSRHHSWREEKLSESVELSSRVCDTEVTWRTERTIPRAWW